MRKKSVLQFIRNRKFLKGCAALSATVLVGVLSFQRQLPDLPGSVPVGTVVTLEEEDTPLAATPVTTTEKKVKKKVTKKKVKLKKAAKKNETKDLGTKRKTKTKTTKSGSTTTKTTILTETHKKEQYKKGKKVKTVTTTVTTTTTVQKTTMPSSTSDPGFSGSDDSGASFSSGDSGGSGSGETGGGTDTPVIPTQSPVPTTAPAVTGGTLSEAQLRESARNFNSEYPLVLDSFIARGCTCVIDPSVGFTGLFDPSTRKITLRKNDETIYHELGHFIALGARRIDITPNFKQIYERECSNFPGDGKIYAASSASEYFAESVREYMASSDRRARLESQCPYTVIAVKSALEYFMDSTINKTNDYLRFYLKQ